MRSLRLELPILVLFTLLSACSGDDGGQTGGSTSESTAANTSNETSTTADTSTDTGQDTGTDTGGPAMCFELNHAIVTDIDETLTTSDAEFIMQLLDSTYDPAERAEGNALITDYHDRGFTIVYLTARSDAQMAVDSMQPASELTLNWLIAHGYPTDEHTRLILAPNFTTGDATIAYKAAALAELQAEGFVFDYAYGNAVTDIAAYDMAGIGKDVTFIIGPEAGVDGTVAVPEEDWATHRAAHMPTVPDYCM
jgi:hypothetical protein